MVIPTESSAKTDEGGTVSKLWVFLVHPMLFVDLHVLVVFFIKACVV